jgi:hypothetical protein
VTFAQDRSLGSVELRVSELAKESDNNRFPYESTGTKDTTDPFRLDKGNVHKGSLHYMAQFVPALAIKGVKFEVRSNDFQRAMNGEQEDEDGDTVDSSSSSSEDGQEVPKGVTITSPKKTHTKAAKSTDTVKTSDTTNTANSTHTSDSIHTAGTTPDDEITAKTTHDDGVEMTTEEVLAQRKLGNTLVVRVEVLNVFRRD